MAEVLRAAHGVACVVASLGCVLLLGCASTTATVPRGTLARCSQRIGDTALASAPELLATTALCARVSELDAVHTCMRAPDPRACRIGANRWPHERATGEIRPSRPAGIDELLAFCRDGQPLRSFVTASADARRERFRAWERFVIETEQLGETIASSCRNGCQECGNDAQQCVWHDGRLLAVTPPSARIFDATDLATLGADSPVAGASRRDLAGSLETIAGGLAAVVEERAHQEVQLYVATRMYELLGCAGVDETTLCPSDESALRPAHFLRSSCAVLRSWNANSGALGSMSWGTLGEALEADLASLPSSMTCVIRGAGSEERRVLAWARFLLHVIAALRDGVDPARFASTLGERLEREPDLPREVRVAALVFIAVTRLPELGRVPPAALVGLTRTLAVQSASSLLTEHLDLRLDLDGLDAAIAALESAVATDRARPRLAADVRSRLAMLRVCSGDAGAFDLPRLRQIDQRPDLENVAQACDALTRIERGGQDASPTATLAAIRAAAREARESAAASLREATAEVDRIVRFVIEGPDGIDWSQQARAVERLDAIGGSSDAGRALAALLRLLGRPHRLAFDPTSLRALAGNPVAVRLLSQEIASVSGESDLSSWEAAAQQRIEDALRCNEETSADLCAAARAFLTYAREAASLLAYLRRGGVSTDCAGSRSCGDDGVMHGWMGAVCFRAVTGMLQDSPSGARQRRLSTLRAALGGDFGAAASAVLAETGSTSDPTLARELFDCVGRARPNPAWVDVPDATLAAEFNPTVRPSEQLVHALAEQVLGRLVAHVCRGAACEAASEHVRALIAAISDARTAAEALGDPDTAGEQRAAHIGGLATAVVRAVLSAVSVARAATGADGGVDLQVPDALPRLIEAVVARDGARILSQTLALVAEIGAQLVSRGAVGVDVELTGDAWQPAARDAIRGVIEDAIRASTRAPTRGHITVHLSAGAGGALEVRADPSSEDLRSLSSTLTSTSLSDVEPPDTPASAIVRFRPPAVLDSIPGSVVRALALGAELAQAETSEDVAGIVDSFAGPVGSYQSKRFRRGVYLTGLVGGVAGGEWYPSRSRDTLPAGGFAFGWHVSLGFDFVLASDPGAGSFGLYLPVLNIAPFTTFAPGGQQDLPSLEGLSLLSPGLFARWEIGDSPFVLAAGLNYTPQLRRYDLLTTNGVPRTEYLDAVQAVLLLAVDVTLFAF